MKYLFKLLPLALFVMNANAITIGKVDLQKSGNKGLVNIYYDGLIKDYPELVVSGSTVSIKIPDAKIKSTVNKAYTFATAKTKDTKVEATQRSGSVTSVKAILPYSLEKMKDKVSLMIKDKRIELIIPHRALKSARSQEVVLKKKPEAKKSYLNESYLDSLIKEDKKIVKVEPTKAAKAQTDTVKTTQSKSKGTPIKTKSSISFVDYAGKFVAFLGVVLLLFYGVITLMKKGFIKKGKLGFLNKTEEIQVLSQTYIAPKKSLMMIKAHDQVFLVSNTEAGIHPISEMNNPMGILKAGEKQVAGMNFDDNVNVADSDDLLDNKITLKKDITKSNKESSLSSYLGVKDQVKFSDQIKKKVKGLKPLQ